MHTDTATIAVARSSVWSYGTPKINEPHLWLRDQPGPALLLRWYWKTESAMVIELLKNNQALPYSSGRPTTCDVAMLMSIEQCSQIRS
jgi:hypothetical protein